MNKVNMKNFVLTSLFAAMIILMTIIPFLGYISVGPIEITTLHVVVIIGSVFLGWKYGALLGAVWGITCIFRAMTLAAANPAFEMFINPMISLVPRILVGMVSGAIFGALNKKLKLNGLLSAGISAVVGTLTNTLLVLSAMYIFGQMIKNYNDIFEMLKTIWLTIIGVNGTIELAAALIIVPTAYKALSKVYRR